MTSVKYVTNNLMCYCSLYNYTAYKYLKCTLIVIEVVMLIRTAHFSIIFKSIDIPLESVSLSCTFQPVSH